MPVDGLGLPSLVQEEVDIGRHLPLGDLLNRYVGPYEELFQIIDVMTYGMGGVVSSLQEPSVAQNRVGNVHGSLLSL